MNVYIATGIFGIISGFVAALADVPLVNPDKGSEQLPLKSVQKWWAEVPEKRFTTSFWLSFLGQPGTYITMWMLAVLISGNNQSLGMALKINTFIGCYTGLLCHLIFCLKPLMYRNIHTKLSEDEVSKTMSSIDKVSVVPLIIGFLSLWLGTTVIIIISIIKGYLEVPKLCLLLNPIPSTVVLMILKKLKIRIIGALGVGFMMFAVLLIVAGIYMG
ncbi:MAG: hypothetical protein IJ763_06850 [Lachnospiraceae bacterium]|nr:hypothetical protein [Lachnospiraceae bacterium]